MQEEASSGSQMIPASPDHDELTGSQIQNIEKEAKCRVIDRSDLILDILPVAQELHKQKYK